MSLCKERAFELLKKISFERVAGTDTREKSAQDKLSCKAESN